MHKLLEIVEKELHEVETKGINTGNIDIVGKLVDMYKDLKMVEEEDHTHVSGRSSIDMHTAGYAHKDAKYDRNINDLYDKYMWCKKEYAEKGASHKEKVVESIENLMSEIGDLIFDIHRDCDFKEEREIVSKHIKGMQDVK